MKGDVEQRPIKVISGKWVMLMPPDPEFEGILTLHILVQDNYEDEPNIISYLAYGSIGDEFQTLYLLHGGELEKGDVTDAIELVLIDISGSEDFRDNAAHLIELSKKPRPTEECL